MREFHTQKLIIFTDLDGSLLDRKTYSYQQSASAVKKILAQQIPLIFCSSKTQSEQEFYRSRLNIPDPFIVENGSAIFIPKGYFTFNFIYQKETAHYFVIELGLSAKNIRQTLDHLRQQTHLAYRGFQELALPELAKITGLPPEAARRATKRDYSETIIAGFSPQEYHLFAKLLKENGLACASGGQFYTVTSKNTNKGAAVVLLIQLFQKKFRDILTIGIGDSRNDLPFLSKVDRPFLIQKDDGTWENTEQSRIVKVKGKGPVGWQKVILQV